ncbi:hypothetical protein F5144DRAFT_88399 [Chaetomium tenue]|uniref:Uncharacterized protein n=1 Tax=Chaetomium tenue TaxID=1854479 RepID=A0ACB7PF75_9PEZI|nr:hypothetical protein F5144DRAFT_88399 [Chaetomium globosum]
MRVPKAPVFRTSLRPAFGQAHRIRHIQSRLATTSPGAGPEREVGNKGTAKEYNKDGTNPNKNVMYAGLAVLGLGGVYAMFVARSDKVGEKAKANSPAAR